MSKPVVRVETERIRFPQVCPVCGRTAAQIARIKVAWGKKEYLRRSWAPYYSRYAQQSLSSAMPPVKIFTIPVCEDHHFPDEGHDRFRTLCLVVDGFAMALMMFALLLIGDALWRNRTVSIIPIGFMLFFTISLLATYFAFRRNILERSIRLVGFDAGMNNVLLSFENDWYQEQFLKENPMTSGLITWIVRAE